MPTPDSISEASFRRMARVKQPSPVAFSTLGDDLVAFYKHSVQKKQSKFGKIAEAWSQLIPETLLGHTCLESFHAGTLKVLVDSSSHLYELKTVLLAGLEKQILLACRSAGLRKVSLKIGRWYDGDDPCTRKLKFD
jgi:hypothetical protein